MEHTHGDTITWWKPNSRGYTVDLEQAGEYSKEQAEAIVSGANFGGKLNEKMWKVEDVLKGKAGFVAKSVHKY